MFKLLGNLTKAAVGVVVLPDGELLRMCDGILSDPVLFHEHSQIVARALKERLSAPTGHIEAQQMDSCPPRESENGVGFWSLPSAEPTPAPVLIVGYDIGNINKGGPAPQNAPKLAAEERACVNQPNKIY